MNLSEICIRRPVFTWVLVAIPAVLGLVSYFSLGVDLFPKVDFPLVAVTANLPGAGAEEMETSVAKPIEESINTVSGIDEMQVTVREGTVAFAVKFVLEKDGNVAAQEIRDKLTSLLPTLPNGTKPPLVDKFDLDSAPILSLAVSGRRDPREVTEIARLQIQEPLQTVSGVGNVFISGRRTRAINIILNADQLAAHALSAEDVRKAIVAQNQEVPGGIMEQGPRELILRTLGRIESVERFNELVVAKHKGYPVRLKDVGRVEDSIEEPRSISRLDGENAVTVFIQKQSGTNTVKVTDAVFKRLEELKKSLPADIRIETIQDQARFIRKSIEEVNFHFLLAAGLVSLTILLFIRDWRTTIIATLAIPTSVVPTFLCMSYMGFTLNNITMLALILAIGIVIDDAVVVHENIFRHMEELGEDAMTAARRGTKEIALAVVATSLSLVVIFLPVAFMGGMVGRFFSSFGVTVAFSIMISLFVSFTLTPMLCSRFLKLEPAGHSNSKSGWFYRRVDSAYGGLLAWCLRRRVLVLTGALMVFFSTVPLAMSLGANLLPRDDQSEFRVAVICPEGYTLQRANRVFEQMEVRLAQLPGVVKRFAVIGENSGRSAKGQGDVTRGSIYIRMKEIADRDYTQFQIMQQARDVLKDFPDLRISVSDVQAIQAQGQDARLFNMILRGPDLDKLAVYSQQMIDRFRREIPGLTDVDSTLSLRKPEIQVVVDRDRAGDLDVPIETVATQLNLLIGGQAVSSFKEGAEQYDVWLRADRPYRVNPQTLDALMLPGGKNGGLIQLSSLAQPVESLGPSQIERFNRQRTVRILASPEGISLNEAAQKARAIVKEMNLPAEYEIEFLGQAKTLGETGYYFAVALGLSILFMYLILAAQFESWLHPVSILASLPITIPFGLASLLLFRQPIDLYALFGLFMLIGIVKKNGILQVDKTNELRRAGMPRDEAILEANHVRLRPILMTTAMLVAAMIPIALGRGPGAGARASMAKVIIGGQMLSLMLALIVTPVAYSLLDGIAARLRRLLRRQPAVVRSESSYISA